MLLHSNLQRHCCFNVHTHVLHAFNVLLGGVTLIRAAAKNHQRVTVVCDPQDYDRYVGLLRLSMPSRAA